jgi:hypothetical protein
MGYSPRFCINLYFILHVGILHRPKWAPWKKKLEEWLEVPMERGLFRLYHFGYQTVCEYILDKK